MTIELTRFACPSPIGELSLVLRGTVLVALDYATHEARLVALLHKRFAGLRPAAGADQIGARAYLAAYFDGDLAALDALPADAGGTPFQARVWCALRAIPAGETRSYAGLAATLGMPKAVRAVAHANALNPIAIVVPCHRVVGSDGALRGYAGGLERKRWLLRHEGVKPG
jgi:methylated-DNA-[protein]-cysteine S-methyltransferase